MENQDLVKFLNQELSNFNVLFVKLHRYHWYIQGPNFFTLHRLFEQLYTEAAEDIDRLAERILAIGGRPLATMSKYLDEATLAEAQADNEEQEIMNQLCKDYRQCIQEIREYGIQPAEENDDQPTADLLNELRLRFEKHIWTFEAYLHHR